MALEKDVGDCFPLWFWFTLIDSLCFQHQHFSSCHSTSYTRVVFTYQQFLTNRATWIVVHSKIVFTTTFIYWIFEENQTEKSWIHHQLNYFNHNSYIFICPTAILTELHELIRDFFGIKDGTLSSMLPFFAGVCVSVVWQLIAFRKTTTSRPNIAFKEAVMKLKGYHSHAVIEAALIVILCLGNWVCWTRSFIRFCISCPQEQNKLNLCFLLLCCSLTKWEIKIHFHRDHVT